AGAAHHASPVTARVRHRTLFVDGGSGADIIGLSSPASAPTVIAVDGDGDGVAEDVVARHKIDDIVIRAGSGDDTVTIVEVAGQTVPFTDVIPTSIRGQSGNDVLLGGAGAEDLRGGSGRDVIDGNRGNDVAAMDGGDDEFIWDPGDGNDGIEGGSGHDLMTFNGNGANETFTATANGPHLRFTRNVGNIVMDTDGVEQVDVNALGGSDFTEINDLSATDVSLVDIDGGVTLGAPGADGIWDSVYVDGTESADAITLSGSAGNVAIAGLATTVTVSDADTIDRLLVASLAGNDVVDASLLGADTMHLDVLAGDGDDIVNGGAGSDDISTGPGTDEVDGNKGDDKADLEEGDDFFIWDPGDGSDIIEGRDGIDAMVFNGSNGDEVFAATAIGERLAFTRDVGNIFMDSAGVEHVVLFALGGADRVTVDDLTGTGVSLVGVNLSSAIGSNEPDGAVDAVTVVGTPGDDAINVSGFLGDVNIDGLTTYVGMLDSDTFDALTIVGNGGTDAIDTQGLADGTVELTIS
ncbi:MAG: calcium-binding protein, partial [Ilumatobacteraceae bacterium]